MELKDMILSTLAELEEPVKEVKEEVKSATLKAPNMQEEVAQEIISESIKEEKEQEEDESINTPSDERVFCESMRERILVLFEGFQSPNNKNIEAKVDLTLNFLEYLLAVIDERLEHLDHKGK